MAGTTNARGIWIADGPILTRIYSPEHFSKGRSVVPSPPKTLAINPITTNDDRVNLLTLTATGYVKQMLPFN